MVRNHARNRSILTEIAFRIRRYPHLHQTIQAAKRFVLQVRQRIVEVIRVLPRPLSLGLPRGIYSDYDLLRAGTPGVEGSIILVDQGNPPAPPDSMTVVAGKWQHRYQPWPIFWARHREAELVGTSLAHVNRDGLISGDAIYGRAHARRPVTKDPSYNYFKGRGSGAVRLEGNWTSLVSQWMPTHENSPYGHWLKDALPRLAVLNELPPDTRILLPAKKLPYMVSSLEMLGVLDRCRWTTETHLSVENYYFSSPPSMIAAYSPYVVDWLRSTYLPLVEPVREPMPQRFYLRRTGDVRNVADEAALIEFFQEIGWAIVDGAALTFPEQIRLFSQAEAICGPHGSGFSNLVWTRPGCRVLEIFSDVHKCAVAEWICHCIPSNQHRYLIFPSDHKLNAIVDIRKVRKALEDYDLLDVPDNRPVALSQATLTPELQAVSA